MKEMSKDIIKEIKDGNCMYVDFCEFVFDIFKPIDEYIPVKNDERDNIIRQGDYCINDNRLVEVNAIRVDFTNLKIWALVDTTSNYYGNKAIWVDYFDLHKINI